MIMPKLIVGMLSTEAHKVTGMFRDQYPIFPLMMSDSSQHAELELYLSRSLGFSFFGLAALCVLLTGSIPLSTAAEPISENDPKAPYAVPVILISSVFHATCAVYGYTWWAWTGQMGYALGIAGYAGLACVGLWCLLFASEGGRISKRTGADKRTSGFPFKNAEAEKKKEAKKSKKKAW